MKNKLYIFVHPMFGKSRGAAQAAHAVAALALNDPGMFHDWNNQTIVILQDSFERLLPRLTEYSKSSEKEDSSDREHINYEVFYDTDLKIDHPTAVAVYPRNDEQRQFCEETFKYYKLL